MIIKQTEKFKTVIISLRFKEEITKENLGLRALLPNLLTNRTNSYKTKKSLTEKLDDLYGAKLGSKVSRFGKLSILDISFSIIHPSIIGEKAFKDALEILNEAVFGHVNLPKIDFEIEKNLLLQSIKAFENNKTAYALSKMQTYMFNDETYGLRVNGTEESVNLVTYESLNKYYKKVIKENDLDVLVSGDISNNMLNMIKSYFTPRNNNNLSVVDYEIKEVNKMKTYEDFDFINQTKVNIGYRLPVRYGDDLYNAAILFNIVLGSGAHSRLFINVREKHSLCYYISSSFDGFKGYSYIYSGVDKSRVDLALKEINKQIKDLQTNLLTDEELNLSKKSLINRIKEADDSQSSSLQVIYQQTMLNNISTIQQRITNINNVTPEQIKQVANMLVQDTMYLLSPEVK